MVRHVQNLLARLRFSHRAWRYRLHVEPEEIAFVLNNVQRGQNVIDIGAHKGAFTYWLNKSVGRRGRVAAFEPLPDLARYLRQIRNLYPFPQLSVVESAVWNLPGESAFYVADGHLGMSNLVNKRQGYKTIHVKRTTLNDYCSINDFRPVHFIKCDGEGSELEILQGADKIIREDRPTLLLEIFEAYREPGHVDRVFNYLRSVSYEGTFFHRGRLRNVSEYDVETYQRTEGPDYCINFGFRSRDRIAA